jgi:hypothetical protein
LEAYGIPAAIAASYTFVLHFALWFPVTALGLYYMAREGISWVSAVRVKEDTPQKEGIT